MQFLQRFTRRALRSDWISLACSQPAGGFASFVYTVVYSDECASSGDARKSNRNLRERGFDFEFATQIFDGSTLERTDSRRDYGERRVIALGEAQDITLTVVYTDRAEASGEMSRRIISARKSNRREREAHKKATNAK